MKRITALFLALLIIVSMTAFSSCEILEKFVTGKNEPSGSDNSNNEANTQHRTTITKDEWLAAGKINNFTFHNVETSYFTGNAYKIVGAENPDDPESVVAFFLFEDEVVYQLHYHEGEWFSVELEGNFAESFNNATLNQFGVYTDFFVEERFEELIYVEDKKAYQLKDSTFYFFFEDGNLVRSEIGDNIWLANIGTTVIDIPDHKTMTDVGEQKPLPNE